MQKYVSVLLKKTWQWIIVNNILIFLSFQKESDHKVCTAKNIYKHLIGESCGALKTLHKSAWGLIVKSIEKTVNW